MGRLLALAVILVLPAASLAQDSGEGPEPIRGPERNLVDNLAADGDTLWAGPRLVFTPDDGQTWFRAGGTDDGVPVFQPPQAPAAIVYSLDVRGDDVWAGLGYRDPLATDNPQTAAGFAFSRDGGHSWEYRFPQLDRPEDTLQVYGVSVLPALPVIVPQLAAPFDVAIDPITRDIWVAGALSGARRLPYDAATDTYAQRFRRVVLPPDTLRSIRPDEPVFFPLVRQIPGVFVFSTNFIAFSVLVDEVGTVWIGTEGGLNRSRAEDVFHFQDEETGEIAQERAWQRFPFDGTIQGLAGGSVVVLAEQRIGDSDFAVGSPENPRNPVWIGAWRPLTGPAQPDEEFSITVTRDGGETFETKLLGERVNDFAFCEEGFDHCAAGTVWAAAEDGLFTSTDDGATWVATRDFRDRDRPGRFVKPGSAVRAVAATRGALWVGTTDGLARSTDGGQTWTIFRADVPVSPAEPTAREPEVEVYAYPNPFSPRRDRVARIRYDSEADRIRIFDFGMNLVRTIDQPAPTEQAWDGLDGSGARVANGVYFYAVEGAGPARWGKIIVLE
jgi:hypothetical protein